MSEATVLESRVSKLEQDNRRLKLTVGVLLLLMAAVPLIGAVMPEQIPELVQARQFQVIDEDEIIRASMNIGGISYYDENRTIRARLTADGFFHWDENREEIRVLSKIGFQAKSVQNLFPPRAAQPCKLTLESLTSFL